jgi:hypothetical protein
MKNRHIFFFFLKRYLLFYFFFSFRWFFIFNIQFAEIIINLGLLKEFILNLEIFNDFKLILYHFKFLLGEIGQISLNLIFNLLNLKFKLFILLKLGLDIFKILRFLVVFYLKYLIFEFSLSFLNVFIIFDIQLFKIFSFLLIKKSLFLLSFLFSCLYILILFGLKLLQTSLFFGLSLCF